MASGSPDRQVRESNYKRQLEGAEGEGRGRGWVEGDDGGGGGEAAACSRGSSKG